MTNHYCSKHFMRRQLLMVAAALLGAMVLLGGLVLPPQEAQSREQQHNKSGQQQSHEQTAPTKNDDAQGQEQQDDTQQQRRLLDKDPKGNEVASGELLVTYKRDASEQAKDEASKKVSGQLQEDFSEIKVRHLSFPEVKNERAQEARQQALEQKKADLERDPAVKAVDYNYVLEGSWVPNDTHYGKQWGYPKIKAPEAWDITQGSSTVQVAVIDSGIDNYHTDLMGKVMGQHDFVNDDTDASDDHGHGTHVAGTVAALTNNGRGVAGTCPTCTLLIAKVLDQNNRGYTSDLISGIGWAANNGARVINMSLGGYPESIALGTAIDSAWSKGAVLVASAGNEGTDGPKYYPAAFDNVIAVAATDSNDARAVYPWWSGSYYDPPTGTYVGASNAGDWVDIAAPGKDIYSTLPSEWVEVLDPSGVKDWKLRPRYEYFHGTSMAAPHVSGLAGLIFSKNGGLSNKEVYYRIEVTAVDLGTSGKDPIFGRGRINAQAALNDYVKIPALTVTSVTPADGASQVRRAANVTATFSEAMDESTLTDSTTFTLVNTKTGAPVPATVRCVDDPCQTAKLDPFPDNPLTKLARKTTYKAKISGAKDEAGNPLADKEWSFTTGRR